MPANLIIFMENLELPLQNVLNFRDCFTFLAEKYKLAIFVEGAPFQEIIQPQDARKAILSGALDKVICSIALLYDYDLFSSPYEISQRLIILRKRYTYPWDLPCISLEEMIRTSQDVKKLLNPFYTPRQFANIEMVENIVNSLSFQQKTDIQKGISVSSLSQKQRQSVEEIVEYSYIGMHAETIQDINFFMSERQIRKHENMIRVTDKRPVVYDFISSESDLGISQEKLKKNNEKRPSVAFFMTQKSVSLKEIFDQVPPTKAGETIEVTSVIAGKSCLMFGASFTNALLLSKALIRLFDLRHVRLNAKNYRLDRRQFLFTQDIKQVSAILQEIIPLPVRRSITNNTYKANNSTLTSWQQDEVMRQIRQESCRRVVVSGNADFRKFKKEFLNIRDTSSFTKYNLGYVFFGNMMEDISRIIEQNIPTYVTQFDKLIITGEKIVHQGSGDYPDDFRIRLNIPTSTGIRPLIGVSAPKRW
jgi:hypothetical protein